ncbi:MFS transporter [Paracoccus stylophorae]|uniref:MFS transporter n=1 Tax=Paracoccus stylophorae TaxID=659350 RepID=A0ABY7SRN3_9RHOB|nr:MFS transporter [Paracoccus stylophorae]WCR09676.1 MFS transporter [Paracoccus stylophorae]
MARIPLRYMAILASVAFLVLGNGLQQTLIGLRAGVEGYAEETVGVMMSAYFVGFVLASVHAPRVIQRVGHIRAFAAFASAGSAFALCFAIFVSPGVWILLRVLQGACYAGMIIVVESWLNASAEASWRGRVLAIYSIVMYAAWAISQPMVALAPVSGFVLFALVSICLSLALVPITLSRAGDPGVVLATRVGLRRLLAISPTALSGAFVMGVAVGAFFGMGPVASQQSGFSDAQTGTILSAALIGALAFQWPLGWLSDLMDRRVIIFGSSVAGAVVAVLFGGTLAQGGEFSAILLAFLLGGALMPLYSICLAEVNDRIAESELIAAASAFVLVYGVGSAVGPFAASLIMGQIGPSGLFAFVGAVLGLFAAFDALRIRQREKTDASAKQSYVATPSTSHAVLPLHEHGPDRAEGEAAPR